jgi:hypothetical protein
VCGLKAQVEGCRFSYKCDLCQVGTEPGTGRPTGGKVSHLSRAQLHAALSYYFDYQKEIDRDLRVRFALPAR